MTSIGGRVHHVRRLATVIAVPLLLVGCGDTEQPPVAASPPAPERTQLEEAASICGGVGEIADGGQTLFFDTKGEEDAVGDSYVDVACVLAALDTPSAVIRHMDTTRALDGTQTDQWGDFSARWTYHPDVGMNLTITRSD